MRINDITTGMKCSIKVKGIRARQPAVVTGFRDQPEVKELVDKGAPPVQRLINVKYDEDAVEDDRLVGVVWPAHVYPPVKRKKAAE